jgi:protein-S-isoprenylcysteine O-methyltransferase Ste14
MIGYIIDVFVLITAIFFFGASHTFLASLKVKNFIRQNYPHLLPFYRLGYNLISFIILYLFFIYLPQPDITIYDLIKPFDFIILGLQILSLLGLIWTFTFFSSSEFLGISQIVRWYKGNYNLNELDEKMTLKIEGPYKYMRHPVYFFSILFLIFRPYMDLTYLTLVICFIAYFYVGSYYEEKKLIEVFGDEYKIYQKTVPRIFPLKPFNPYNV